MGRGGGRTVRGGHFGADYSNMGLDYNKVNATSNNYRRMRELFLFLGKLSVVSRSA